MKLDPDYEDIPEVEEIRCQEGQFFSCTNIVDRDDLLKHYQDFHKEYGYETVDDVEPYFEHERERRYQS